MTDATGDQGERHQASISLDIEASPDRVWQVLTEPDLVRRYLHGTDMDADWREGGHVVWRGSGRASATRTRAGSWPSGRRGSCR
jgi:uncharacterized protein YndB with AHSA1/START domain